MKKFLLIFTAAILAVLLVSCSGEYSNTDEYNRGTNTGNASDNFAYGNDSNMQDPAGTDFDSGMNNVYGSAYSNGTGTGTTEGMY